MIPIGYPTGRWGTASRKPANEFVYSEAWDNPVTWTVSQTGQNRELRTTTNKGKMDFAIPEKTQKLLAELDAFIEDVIAY